MTTWTPTPYSTDRAVPAATAHHITALLTVAHNYYETKRDRNAAKRTRRARAGK